MTNYRQSHNKRSQNLTLLNKKRYCIFAAYNKENKITKELIFYLEELNKIVDGIVFVMDNPLDIEEKKKLENLTIYNECKKHNEYDFGSYKRGFLYLKENDFLDDTGELIFANDSCYGPLKSLNLFIEKWEKENKPDFYGITVNNYGQKYSTLPSLSKHLPHIQSYFFLITKNIFNENFFIKFINSIRHMDTYTEITKAYEVGLSRLIAKNGFVICTYFDFGKFQESPVYKGKAMLKTVKDGFFIKKKNFNLLSKNKNLCNYFLYKSIFPYIMNNNGDFICKKQNNFNFVYLLKHILSIAASSMFNIENKDIYKVFTIFGLRFKFKRYNYKIAGKNNSLMVIDGDSKTTPKEKKINGLEIVIKGKNNKIILSPNYKFKNSKIEICADNCTVDIKSKHLVSNLNVKFEKENYQSLTVDKEAKILDLNINSTTQDVLIEVKDGEISNSTANIEAFADEENRPRMIIKQGV